MLVAEGHFSKVTVYIVFFGFEIVVIYFYNLFYKNFQKKKKKNVLICLFIVFADRLEKKLRSL